MRECGLKQSGKVSQQQLNQVTPRAGVWIETSSPRNVILCPVVTPRAGVWIETISSSEISRTSSSHSPCGSVD